MASEVCTASRVSLWSPAPRYWEMTTPAPVAKPLKKPMSILITGPTLPTAASASLPTKFPTTTLSTVLYSC